ncbi:hypothetical protein GALMADRAFT_216741 [Galerina marginata CBS 339.88]|uniref:G domain-containing protein n=1 Tax=Galerina marginata (strain CBS 339.88) TaxID=685588 RepID=A0A067SJA5_GALM3|nr:hypothetical protein GALMADRAFT_216741 [Galerina marginata CBS 339.88]
MNSPNPRVILVGAKGSGKSKLVSSICGNVDLSRDQQSLLKILSMSEEAIDHEYFNILLSSSHSRGVIYVDMHCPGYISREITIVDLPGLTWTGYSSTVKYIHKLTCYYTMGNERSIVALFPHATDGKREIQALQFLKRRGHDMRLITMVIGIAHTTSQVHHINPIGLNVMGRSSETPHRCLYFLAPVPHAPSALSSTVIQEMRQEEAAYFLFSKPWSAQPRKDNLGIPNILKEWVSLWALSSQAEVSGVQQTGSWIGTGITIIFIFFLHAIVTTLYYAPTKLG